ncbi:MAG: hypothetical protein RBS08_05110 [Bdellovibrionales bacterium]|jgi:hypothetical protein|nr:hypothetical protein [Bdellovibrionales bacterium]
MKMFPISLAVATVLCLPQMMGFMATDTPPPMWLRIPADGMTYLMLFFHEIGHTVGWWIFGYPALPSFNFEYGGGMTYSFTRSWLVLGGVWLGAAVLGAKLWQSRDLALLGILGGAVLLHGILILTGGDQLLPIATGHLAEIFVGSFCLLRAFLGTTDSRRGAVERWLNMIFGCFTLVHNVGLTGLLMFHDIGRAVYAAQKGGHLQGDMDRIAIGLGLPLPVIAGTLMALAIGIFAAAIYYGYTHAPQGPLEDKKTARRI